MSTVNIVEYQRENVLSRRIKLTVAADETTQWFEVAATGGAVAVNPSGGTMRAELTSSPASIVKGDNENATSNAIAFKWAPGDVGSLVQQEFIFATAIRFISVGAGGTAEISE
jgi:hypothetical protein